MEKSEFAILVKGMKAVWPDPKFIADEYASQIWFARLKDIPYKLAYMAVMKIMDTSKKPPTIADIKQEVREMSDRNQLTEMEAWSLVRTAIRNSGYHADEEFENLPDVCKRAIGSPANLRELSQMDQETVESVEQSHFIRAYRTSLDRQNRSDQSNISGFLQRIAEGKKTEQIAKKETPVVEQKPERSEVDYKRIEEKIAGMWGGTDGQERSTGKSQRARVYGRR